MVGPNLPFGGLACGLVLGPLPSEQVIRHPRWRLVHNVLVDEKLRKLLEIGYVTCRQANEPFQRCSLKRAHKHLAIDSI